MSQGPLRALIESSPQGAASTPAQTSIGTTAAVILAANQKRKGLFIQNTGTTVIKLTFGATLPTQTVYHVALAASTSADDGKGGVYVDDATVTAVNAISSAAGGTFVLTEFTIGNPDWNQACDFGRGAGFA
jgi:hypothetical protein